MTKQKKGTIGPVSWEDIEAEIEDAPLVEATKREDGEEGYSLTLAGFFFVAKLLDEKKLLDMKSIDIDEAVSCIMLGKEPPSAGLYIAMKRFGSGCADRLRLLSDEIGAAEPNDEQSMEAVLLALAFAQADAWAKSVTQ